MNIYNPQIECMDRESMRALQLERLKKTVRYTYDNVEHYRNKLSSAGVKPEDIRSLEDIRYIPFSTKADMRDNYPFGLLARPLKDMVRVQAYGGGLHQKGFGDVGRMYSQAGGRGWGDG